MWNSIRVSLARFFLPKEYEIEYAPSRLFHLIAKERIRDFRIKLGELVIPKGYKVVQSGDWKDFHKFLKEWHTYLTMCADIISEIQFKDEKRVIPGGGDALDERR